jgi:hypothetical protein
VRQQRGGGSVGLVKQRLKQMGRFDECVVCADRKALRVGEGLLEFRGELVETHVGSPVG